jgi:release factor glutamine methyltransferase
MLTYSQAFYQLKERLRQLYDEGEAGQIAHSLLEHITGLNRLDRLAEKDKQFSPEQQQRFDGKTTELLNGKPVQYVINSAWFLGREFFVNGNVLIPRPETEELVEWIASDSKSREKLTVVDIGAGSGCIGISLARLLIRPSVTCIDISKGTLEVVQANIDRVLTDEEKAKVGGIELKQLNFLDANERNSELGRYDIIVSNPPYIPEKEQEKMHINVKDHEPHIALFVPDSDALVFYRAIAAFGKEHLRQDGAVYCELDAAHAAECKFLFETEGYNKAEIRKDMHGNWRMLKAAF